MLQTLMLLCLGPWFLLVGLPLFFKFKTLAYRFDDEGVSMSWGLMWRREIHLTYARIQDIHVSRGLFERWLGLATIQIQTASGNVGAEMSLLGIRDHDTVRNFLYSKMRGARLQDEAPSDASPEGLLVQIRDELRGLRHDLSSERSG